MVYIYYLFNYIAPCKLNLETHDDFFFLGLI
jgi:hypothetical protein